MTQTDVNLKPGYRGDRGCVQDPSSANIIPGYTLAFLAARDKGEGVKVPFPAPDHS